MLKQHDGKDIASSSPELLRLRSSLCGVSPAAPPCPGSCVPDHRSAAVQWRIFSPGHLCCSVCQDPDSRIHSDQDCIKHSFPPGASAVGVGGGRPQGCFGLCLHGSQGILVARPPGLWSQRSAEAKLHTLPWSLPANTCPPLPGAAYKLVCYFTSWAQGRASPASVLPQDLDPFLCTHLIFAFASMNNNQIVAKDPQDEKTTYAEFNKLKQRCVHRHVGIIFSGGPSLLSSGPWEHPRLSTPC